MDEAGSGIALLVYIQNIQVTMVVGLVLELMVVCRSLGHHGCWFDTKIYINWCGLGLAMVATIPPPNNLVSNFLHYI